MQIELKGGLGNQLFQYAAGVFLIEKLDRKVTFKTSNPKLHKVNQQTDLADFNFKFEIEPSDVINRSWKLLMQRMIRRVMKYYFKFRSRGNVVFNSYESPVTGFDSNLGKIASIRKISGYFQTHLYVDAIKQDFVSQLTLRNVSSVLKTFLSLRQIENPIMIHVRGRDFKSHINSSGLLSTQYFQSALEIAAKIIEPSHIWFFSDDEEYCDETINKLKVKNCRRIYPNSGLSSAETLVLMSNGSGIIISNSTFSWWAAYLSKKSEFVIAPDKWFRNMEDPSYLIPSSWIKAPSSWSI
jgi:hypothetical protein